MTANLQTPPSADPPARDKAPDRWTLGPGDFPSPRALRLLRRMDRDLFSAEALAENPVFRYLSMKRKAGNPLQRGLRLCKDGGLSGRYLRDHPIGLPRAMLRDLALTPARGPEIVGAILAHHLRRTRIGAILFQIAVVLALWSASGWAGRWCPLLRWVLLLGVVQLLAKKSPQLDLAMIRHRTRLAMIHEAAGSKMIAWFKQMWVLLPIIAAGEVLFLVVPAILGFPPFGRDPKWSYAPHYGAVLFAVYLFVRARAARNLMNASADVDKLLKEFRGGEASK